MRFLASALDPVLVQQRLTESCPDWVKGLGQIEVQGIRVVRYKPERRCLIEYQLAAPGLPAGSIVIIGKVRAKGLDRKTFDLLSALWHGNFGPHSEDGVHVPEPIGAIPAFQMWLQRKVPGLSATELLAKPNALNLARRIAEGICKLHRANISAHRSHTINDELQILHERLPSVAVVKPALGARLERLLGACDRLGATVAKPGNTGIHRDFYPGQLLVNGMTLYLLDFDLFCNGDPALDAGNFLGHLTEQSLRTLGGPDALADAENGFQQRFLELAGKNLHASVMAYTALTLVRHIWLSTQFPDRIAFTEPLMVLCEERLTNFL